MREITFTSYRSEAEVRMTLRELCGSALDNYPFRGEVESSSFSLIKNRWVRSNVANPLLRGQFCETDGETRITIRATYRVMDMVGHMITAVIFLAMAIYIFIISASDSLIMACGCSGVILIIGAVWALVSYLLFVLNVRSSVSWLKRALGVR